MLYITLFLSKFRFGQCFILRLGQKTQLLVTPSEPQYFHFVFPQDVDSVVVKLHSSDKLCMTASVQPAKVNLAIGLFYDLSAPSLTYQEMLNIPVFTKL